MQYSNTIQDEAVRWSVSYWSHLRSSPDFPITMVTPLVSAICSTGHIKAQHNTPMQYNSTTHNLQGICLLLKSPAVIPWLPHTSGHHPLVSAICSTGHIKAQHNTQSPTQYTNAIKQYNTQLSSDLSLPEVTCGHPLTSPSQWSPSLGQCNLFYWSHQSPTQYTDAI